MTILTQEETLDWLDITGELMANDPTLRLDEAIHQAHDLLPDLAQTAQDWHTQSACELLEKALGGACWLYGRVSI